MPVKRDTPAACVSDTAGRDFSSRQGNDIEPSNFLKEAIAGKPITHVKFGNCETLALVDTGSQVSMISQKFFEEHMKPYMDKLYPDRGLFTLTRANGLEVPNLGFLVVDVTIQGKTLPDIGNNNNNNNNNNIYYNKYVHIYIYNVKG